MPAALEIDQGFIATIKQGDRLFLKTLYEQYRDEFVHWLRSIYRIDREQALEIYQEAFTAFYYNIREGKLTQLSSSMKTYLFAVGRNRLRDKFKAEKKYADVSSDINEEVAIDHNVLEKYEQHHLKQKMKDLLEKIGEPCITVLQLYYYRHYSMEAIASQMGYKSKQVAAKRKFICLKQMRELLQNED